MTKDILMARIQELLTSVQTSAENYQMLKNNLDNVTHAHNALVGRLEEAKNIYQQFEAEKPVEMPLVEPIVE